MDTEEIDIPCQHCGLPNRIELKVSAINGKCENCDHTKAEHDEHGHCSGDGCLCMAYDEM